MSQPILLLDVQPEKSADYFDDAALRRLAAAFRVIERGTESRDAFYATHLDGARYVVGRPPLTRRDLARCGDLRAVFNYAGRFRTDVAYADCARLGVRLLTPGPVFARPVGELALGFALSLARDIHGAHLAFREGRERYGDGGSRGNGLLHGRSLGLVGFGLTGRAVLDAFRAFAGPVRVHDPRLSRWELETRGLIPATLVDVLGHSDVVVVTASLTERSRGLIGASELALTKPGAMFLLLSRAGLVDFDALRVACETGRLMAAADVFPTEPVAADDPLRRTPNLLLSPHRAGVLANTFREVGTVIAEDLALMERGLEPRNCTKADPSLVADLDRQSGGGSSGAGRGAGHGLGHGLGHGAEPGAGPDAARAPNGAG